MASLNRVELIGNLGSDPKEMGNGVVTFSLATTERWTDRSGEKQETTEWHRIVVFGKTAESAAKWLQKGTSVYLDGRIQSRKYQDKDGIEKTVYEIVCGTFKILSNARQQGATQQQPGPAPARPERAPAPTRPSPEGQARPNVAPDDFPF